jgi:hypothetical protein
VYPITINTIKFACFINVCETWSIRLREELMLRVLRKIFGPGKGGSNRKLEKTA